MLGGGKDNGSLSRDWLNRFLKVGATLGVEGRVGGLGLRERFNKLPCKKGVDVMNGEDSVSGLIC